jgi:hypothetical protein
VRYTSQGSTILPDEIRKLLSDVEKYVLKDKYEEDKIPVHFSYLKHRIIEWFLDHEEPGGEG